MFNYNEAKERTDKILRQLNEIHFLDYINQNKLNEYGVLKEELREDAPNDIFGYPIVRVGDFSSSVNLPGDLNAAVGATRIVFWDAEERDYVIKIGLTPTDEEYCAKEVAIYNAAVEENAEEAFAGIQLIYDGNTYFDDVLLDRGIYAMEYFDCDEDEIASSSTFAAWRRYCEENEIDINDSAAYDRFYDDLFYDAQAISESIIDFAIETSWSPELSRKVLNIINTFEINDLHSGNWSMNDGRMVIIDYGCF